MVRVAVADIGRLLRWQDHELIESTVRRHIRACLDRARITTYVGIIAKRHALAELRGVQANQEQLGEAIAGVLGDDGPMAA
jgi:hypothetical protein